MPFGTNRQSDKQRARREREGRNPSTGQKPVRVSVPYAPTPTGKAAERRDSASRVTSSSGSSPSSSRSRPPLTPALTGSAITSLASRYLLETINEATDPNASIEDRLGITALKDAAVGLDEVGDELRQSRTPKGRRKVRRERVQYRQQLEDPLGKRSLGDISLADLMKASKQGTVRQNKAGQVTTPPVRRAVRDLANLRKRRKRLSGPLPGLDRHQTRVARTVLRQGDRLGATPREDLAAIMTGLVESNFRNLGYGDRDSEGWRQERTSLYGTGPTGPRNVRASARRFYNELRTDPGTSTAATPGLLAQAAQGSAFPGRYDEQEAAARAILGAYERGGTPGPNLRRRLTQATARAQALGIPTGQGGRRGGAVPDGQVRKTPTIVQVGLIAQDKFGLTVREQSHFDQVDPVHTDGSYHYSDQAIDVSGDPAKLAAFNRFVASRFGDQLAEMFYDPGINIDNGQPTTPIGGHGTHVHVAIDEPGSEAHGLLVQGHNLGASGGAEKPIGFYGAGATPEAARQSAQRAREGAFVSLMPISTPLAASAALPNAYSGLGAEEEGGEEAPEDNYIAQILRRSRS